ncbi:unnamed protein product [Diatraea saccharalis]|uniref:Aldehyde oxidase/xanthine dehydrogenase second molybdopterin binding domain-containing protein n=1 Tax=Diatraea saccharalis TaxID=40085 RepID=A0A9P0C5N2_9NEOP|nr:unnamed protein product [Diatraea saccharalis]
MTLTSGGCERRRPDTVHGADLLLRLRRQLQRHDGGGRGERARELVRERHVERARLQRAHRQARQHVVPVAGSELGTTEAIAIMEHIMERIAHATGKDPIDVRITNLDPEHISIKDMIDSFKRDTDYDERRTQIAKYNADNAWKKKGLKLAIMCFPISYEWNIPSTVSVYHGDGTVSVSHGGIEMGQGINTKVAQVCAYTLKVPLEKVTVLGTDSFVSPNSVVSSGSVASECVAYSTIKACEDLLRKLEPARNGPDQSWEDVVKKAYEKGINLQSNYMMSQTVDKLKPYNVYGVCVAEVELDVLTGRHEVTRVDFLEDVGISLSPDIDVGQVYIFFY